MASWEQYGILVFGLLIAGGFAFGGIASYAGLTNTGNQNAQDEFNATVPDENYVEGSFDLTQREQMVLAYRDNFVFVNVFHNESEENNLSQLKQLPDSFNDRVYVRSSDTSEASTMYYAYNTPQTDLPMAVVVGGNQGYRTQPLEDLSQERLSSEVCDAFRSIDPVSTRCIG